MLSVYVCVHMCVCMHVCVCVHVCAMPGHSIFIGQHKSKMWVKEEQLRITCFVSQRSVGV